MAVYRTFVRVFSIELSARHGMAAHKKGRPKEERPCESLDQLGYATGSIFSRPPM